jgi:hypothetical protein
MNASAIDFITFDRGLPLRSVLCNATEFFPVPVFAPILTGLSFNTSITLLISASILSSFFFSCFNLPAAGLGEASIASFCGIRKLRA